MIPLEPKNIWTVSDCTFPEVKSMLVLFPIITLMMDAARVIELRVRMMSLGQSTPTEMFLMVSEKMNALEEAQAILARVVTPPSLFENYQKIFTANVVRLSGAQKF
jgi:hypothetical protein